MSSTKIEKIIDMFLIIVLIFATITVILSGFLSPKNEYPPKVSSINFSYGWTYESSNHETQTVSLPAENIPAETPFYLSKKLPKTLPSDAVIYLKISNSDLTVHIGAETIPIDGVYKNRAFNTTVKQMMATIPLEPSHGGQTITLEVTEKRAMSGINIGDVQIINQSHLIRMLLCDKTLTLILSISLAVLAGMLLTIVAVCYMQNVNFKYSEFAYLSLFIFLSSIWMITDSRILELFTGYNDAYDFVSFYAFLLLPVPFLMFIREILSTNKQALNVLVIMFLLLFTVSSCLMLTGVIPSLVPALPLVHMLVAVSCVLIPYYCFLDYKKYKKFHTLRVIHGMLFFAPISALALLLFYTSASNNYSDAFKLGLFIFIIFLSFDAISYLADAIKKARESNSNEAKALHAQNTLMVSQISTHFFYHVMSTTRSLIKTNPSEAHKMLGNISKYLRYNTDSSNVNQHLVLFSDEMKAIRAYVDIEKVLMGERLNVIYDIRVDNFYIPVLTVQPLVENAIKHGIGRKINGGTIRVKSKETMDCYMVTIEDNGVGFDEEISIDDKYASIGQSNINERLTYYGNSEIIIDSTLHSGTKITLKFSKEFLNSNHKYERENNENNFS